MCIKPVIANEIKKGLFSIKGDKAPGPYGYNSPVNQDLEWDIIRQDLIEAVQHFFVIGLMLKEWNYVHSYYFSSQEQ